MPYKDKEERNKYKASWIAKRRKDWFNKAGPCIECGSADNLELDHIDSDTKIDHRVWGWSEERRLRELDKCQVLCKECHKKKSLPEKAKGEDNSNVKLSNKDVQKIRELASSGVRNIDLAKKFNVHKTTIGDIVLRKSWKHI